MTTRFKAPELLLGSPSHSAALDLWSVGATFGEMIRRKSLFRGDCEIAQLYQIFMRLGTPTEELWPGVSQFPYFSTEFPKWPRRKAASMLTAAGSTQLCPEGQDLLERLLEYVPGQRISALEALAHPYFQETTTAKDAN